ncbi:MAG TPA: tetratricopeptide repeat protein, partial [Gemmataceae bacterium]|nr:tetratricopeptide repeat protein [Gemmataceae bacterium]
GKAAEAVRYFTAAVALRPNNPGVLVNRAQALSEAHDVEAAILDLRRAAALAPNYAVAHTSLGHALFVKGDQEGALAALRRAIALDPKSGRALSNIGLVYMDRGDLAVAVEFQRKALAADPKDRTTRFHVGEALGRLGKWQEAISSYEDLTRLLPNDAWGFNQLAWLLATCPDANLRDGARAVEMAKKGHQIGKSDGFSWNTLGVAHYRAGNWTEAVAALQRSRELFAGRRDAMNTCFLAMANWRLGNKREARKWYDQAVEWMEKNEPEDEFIGEYLRRFHAEAEELLGVKEKKQ